MASDCGWQLVSLRVDDDAEESCKSESHSCSAVLGGEHHQKERDDYPCNKVCRWIVALELVAEDFQLGGFLPSPIDGVDAKRDDSERNQLAAHCSFLSYAYQDVLATGWSPALYGVNTSPIQ